ncbi:MAG TPA: hypothetical protein VGP82_26350, partial [Ktedonobacterales bacterium]|nr:hypothetical protein [Ktedonobacterales bacterium]
GLGLLIALILLVVAGIFAYPRVTSFLNDYFAANGTWYGPMHVQTGPTQEAIETYMDLSTLPTGSITGGGEFCLPNLLGGGTSTAGFGVAGQRQGDGTFTLTISSDVSGPLGLRVLVGPQLQMKGTIASGTFHLTGGGGNAPTTTTLKHGTKTSYISACHTLAPLSIG